MNAHLFVKNVLDGLGGNKLKVMKKLKGMRVRAIEPGTGRRLNVTGVTVQDNGIVLYLEVA